LPKNRLVVQTPKTTHPPSDTISIHQVHAEWLKNLEIVCRKKTGKEKKQARIVYGNFGIVFDIILPLFCALLRSTALYTTTHAPCR